MYLSFHAYHQLLMLKESLTQGIVPDELKIAKVIPTFKGGDDMLINNYLPVSILPVFSKVQERLMYNRLYSFITKHNILYKYQFGFREKHGINLALIVLVDRILSTLQQRDIVLGVFLDVSKAFNTVHHQILLNKLSMCGIRGLANKWFDSHLSNRKHSVMFNNTRSNQRNITCDVPQESILGSLLFFYM